MREIDIEMHADSNQRNFLLALEVWLVEEEGPNNRPTDRRTDRPIDRPTDYYMVAAANYSLTAPVAVDVSSS